MKQYEDPKTGAIKYDLYFSDKQIKTGFEQNGELVPFRHNKIIDKKTGEPLLMYRISLRDSQHRSFQFKDPKLNSGSCFIQIPADSVSRKIKGLTSVYTVTTAYKDTWRTVVYSGDINARDGWRGPSEKINLDDLSKCLEYQTQEHLQDKKTESVSEESKENPVSAADIDSFFPKGNQAQLAEKDKENAIEKNPEQNSLPDETQSLKSNSEQGSSDRMAALEALVVSQQAEINALKEQVASLTEVAKSIDQRTESFGGTLDQISKDHKALIDIYARIKDWSRNMLGKYTNLEYTVDTVRSEVSRLADQITGRSRSPKIDHKR